MKNQMMMISKIIIVFMLLLFFAGCRRYDVIKIMMPIDEADTKDSTMLSLPNEEYEIY